MLKSSSIFRMNGAHLVEKRSLKKNKIHFRSLSVLNMSKHFWFVSNFVSNCVKFAINEKYSKKNYDNPNYYALFVIFRTYKNVV
jgi:hypothetical protein